MEATIQPITLDVQLHDAQLEVWNSPARFKVVACGRRFGKTFLGVNMIIAAAGSKPESINWWVAPRHDQTDVAFRFFKEALPRELLTINHTKKTARLWNGSIVAFKTASDPDALRSEGLDFVVLDEAAFQKPDVWPAVIRPALADKKGQAALIGTFDGENWFYDMYQRGQSIDEFLEWESWRFPSSANPFLDPEEIEEARRGSTEAVFEQEWMANPLVYVGAVFDGESVQRASERGVGIAWRSDLSTYAGLDWGHNTTAFEICQEDAEERVYWLEERIWHAVELNERCGAITELCRLRSVEVIYADAAGASEIMTLDGYLRRAGLKTEIQPIPFGKYKDDGIMTRQYYLERGLEAIGSGCPQLLKDSKRYHYKEGTDDVVKEDDHTVDSATAFYAWRRDVLMGMAGAGGAR